MIHLQITDIDKKVQDHFNRVCNDSEGKKGPDSIKGLISIVQNKIKAETDSPRRTFYETLLEDIKPGRHVSLISATPDQLHHKMEFYQKNFGAVMTEDFRKSLLKSCFFYHNYDKWGAYELAKDLGVNVCPYCNRQYTFTMSSSTGKTRPQFDHFYDKATYPYLSMSFYNLVPSCSICNSGFKGSTKFSFDRSSHPYIEGFDPDIKFTIKPYNVSFINGKSSAYKIKFAISNKAITVNKKYKAGRNIYNFKLVELYNHHKDYVDELIIKARIYNQDYIESLFREFQGTLFGSIEDVKRMIVSNYTNESELGKRVLSKLTADISAELGLI